MVEDHVPHRVTNHKNTTRKADNMTTSFLLNPTHAPTLDDQIHAIKKKYTLYGWLRNEMKPVTLPSGKTVISDSIRQKSGNWQDFTINMAKIQAAMADGSLDTSKPVAIYGAFYQTSEGKPVLEALSIQNALSDDAFKDRNNAHRANSKTATAAPTDLDDGFGIHRSECPRFGNDVTTDPNQFAGIASLIAAIDLGTTIDQPHIGPAPLW